MNRTPRALNRTLLLIVGVIGVCVGAAALAAVLLPKAQEAWKAAGVQMLTWATELFDRTSVAQSHSWIWFLLLAIIAIALLLGVLVIARQGGGRTSTLIKRDSTETKPSGTAASGAAPKGAVVIDTGLAETLLAEAITQDPAVLSVQVTSYRVQGETAMRVSLALRRGASPAAISRRVEHTVATWDRMLGAEIPVVVEITSGIRARRRSEVRVT